MEGNTLEPLAELPEWVAIRMKGITISKEKLEEIYGLMNQLGFSLDQTPDYDRLLQIAPQWILGAMHPRAYLQTIVSQIRSWKNIPKLRQPIKLGELEYGTEIPQKLTEADTKRFWERTFAEPAEEYEALDDEYRRLEEKKRMLQRSVAIVPKVYKNIRYFLQLLYTTIKDQNFERSVLITSGLVFPEERRIAEATAELSGKKRAFGYGYKNEQNEMRLKDIKNYMDVEEIHIRTENYSEFERKLMRFTQGKKTIFIVTFDAKVIWTSIEFLKILARSSGTGSIAIVLGDYHQREKLQEAFGDGFLGETHAHIDKYKIYFALNLDRIRN